MIYFRRRQKVHSQKTCEKKFNLLELFLSFIIIINQLKSLPLLFLDSRTCSRPEIVIEQYKFLAKAGTKRFLLRLPIQGEFVVFFSSEHFFKFCKYIIPQITFIKKP